MTKKRIDYVHVGFGSQSQNHSQLFQLLCTMNNMRLDEALLIDTSEYSGNENQPTSSSARELQSSFIELIRSGGWGSIKIFPIIRNPNSERILHPYHFIPSQKFIDLTRTLFAGSSVRVTSAYDLFRYNSDVWNQVHTVTYDSSTHSFIMDENLPPTEVRASNDWGDKQRQACNEMYADLNIAGTFRQTIGFGDDSRLLYKKLCTLDDITSYMSRTQCCGLASGYINDNTTELKIRSSVAMALVNCNESSIEQVLLCKKNFNIIHYEILADNTILLYYNTTLMYELMDTSERRRFISVFLPASFN